MSTLPLRTLVTSEFPALLQEIPCPPKELWIEGSLPRPGLTLLSVVGSRRYSTYGKQVVEHLMAGLKGYDIGIVSGLALGIDGLAHEAALANELYTLAVPGSGLDPKFLYPASHRRLARRIIESGGGLLSELAPTTSAAKWTFPARNRLMAGLTRATLLVEAGAKSGTLITARLAADYNREVLVVPGSIFSANSYGVHQFMKLGATPVTTAADIIEVLGLTARGGATPRPALSPATTLILSHLTEPTDKDTLIRRLNKPISEANTILMQAELDGHISQENGTYTALTNWLESK